MTALNRSEDVAQEVFRRMQGITKANGYETDMGLHATQGRVRREDDLDVACTLVEGPDRVVDAPGTVPEYVIAQRYVLVGYLNVVDANNPNVDAHKILRDFKRAIFLTDGKADGRFGGLVKKVEYRGRDLAPRSDGMKMIMALIEIDVTFVERVAMP